MSSPVRLADAASDATREGRPCPPQPPPRGVCCGCARINFGGEGVGSYIGDCVVDILLGRGNAARHISLGRRHAFVKVIACGVRSNESKQVLNLIEARAQPTEAEPVRQYC